MSEPCTTGLSGLDKVLKGVLPGDNVVWQVERWEEYRDFVTPYAGAACKAGRRLIYFRFASHPPLLKESDCYQVHRPDPSEGFEAFVNSVHDVITDSGEGSVCVFDCLSDLSLAWRADSMLGNFFMLTCPRLLEFQRLTYFGLYRHTHSERALTPIRETTQFLLDVFSHRDHLYIRPLKVQYRSGEVLNQIHMRVGHEDFVPVQSSAEIADVLRSSDWRGLLAEPQPDRWQRLVKTARDRMRQKSRGLPVDAEEKQRLFDDILSELIGTDTDTRMRLLATRVLRMEDLLSICDRLIGTGRIGGKASGMLVARAVLRKNCPDLSEKLEAHDSFHIGSDIYYTFLIQNRLWWIRQAQRNEETYLDELETARERILSGVFPDHVVEQFRHLLAYFGEAPFIVRSSSLLEDAYGNAFAGKYDSVFCVNQGPPDERLEALLDAVREVYASAMGEEALRYRKRRGLLDRDEQMSLLLQRVSGQRHGRYYYPHLAGVGLSFNPYVWHRDIDPESGVLRLVFGLGTRAVDTHEDDHTRILALNEPELLPSDVFESTQRKMDALDFVGNRMISGPVHELIEGTDAFPMPLFVSVRPPGNHPFLTFRGLLRETELIPELRQILQILEKGYGVPVDVEFSVNFLRDGTYRINILQCRPFQVRNSGAGPDPGSAAAGRKLIEAEGPVIGTGLATPVDRVVLVNADAYSGLNEQKQRAAAKAIGRINRQAPSGVRCLLIGPGRWGTREPSMGVPVRFGDISRAVAVIELTGMHGHLLPDASLGTHFLNELIECEILYTCIDPRKPETRMDLDTLSAFPNRLRELLPDAEPWLEQTLRVIEPPGLHFHADVFTQRISLLEQE